MNKQILIVRKYKGFGGIEHQILGFSKALKKKGWNIYFLTDQKSPVEQALKESGITTFVRPFDGHLKVAWSIVGICEHNDIHIIQAHMLNEDFSCRLAKIICPSLKHVFRVHTYIDCSRISRLKKNIYHIADFLTNSLVDMYFPINKENAVELTSRSYINNRKIKIIHDSVREMRKSECDRSYPKNHVIAMIANFEDFKGHDVLLSGIRELKDRGEKVIVHLIGGVPGLGTDNEKTKNLDEVKKRIEELSIKDEIHIDGYCENIPDATKECGILVLPSDSEGTPNSLLEGMMLEKIVVASKVGGVPEFVFEGVTGFLHEPQNSKDFADAIIRVYSKTDKELEIITNNAKKFVIEHFSLDDLVDEIIMEYLMLLL